MDRRGARKRAEALEVALAALMTFQDFLRSLLGRHKMWRRNGRGLLDERLQGRLMGTVGIVSLNNSDRGVTWIEKA